LAERDAEDCEEEQCADDRPANGLGGDGQEPLDLTPIEGGDPDPVHAIAESSCRHLDLQYGL
jgi:hypothetical protein